jgi:PLAT/LH2 domain
MRETRDERWEMREMRDERVEGKGYRVHYFWNRKVFLEIIGNLRNSQRLQLESDRNNFTRGKTDTFKLSFYFSFPFLFFPFPFLFLSPITSYSFLFLPIPSYSFLFLPDFDTCNLDMLEVGQISKIKIGHDGKGGGWFLEKVNVVNLRTNVSYNFAFGQWLSTEYLFIFIFIFIFIFVIFIMIFIVIFMNFIVHFMVIFKYLVCCFVLFAFYHL